MSDSYNDSGASQNLTTKPLRKRAARTHGFAVDKRVVIALVVTAVIMVLASVAYSTGKFGKQSRTASEEAAYQREKHRDEDGADIPGAPPQPNSASPSQKGENAGD